MLSEVITGLDRGLSKKLTIGFCEVRTGVKAYAEGNIVYRLIRILQKCLCRLAPHGVQKMNDAVAIGRLKGMGKIILVHVKEGRQLLQCDVFVITGC